MNLAFRERDFGTPLMTIQLKKYETRESGFLVVVICQDVNKTGLAKKDLSVHDVIPPPVPNH